MQFDNIIKTYLNIQEACWKGYTKRGMKKKGKRIVPNCVKKKAKKTK
jgi:hypothetical protein